MPASTSTYVVRRQDQLTSLASPVRIEILDAIRVNGPCSIGRVGEFLGRAPDSLYYHVRKLVRVGLLIECGKHKSGRRDGALYKTPAPHIRTPFELERPERAASVRAVYDGLLRLTQRDLRDTVRSGGLASRGSRRNIRHARLKGRLTRSELREANRHIDALLKIFSRRKNPEQSADAPLYALTTFLLPLRGARRSKQAP